MRADNAARNSIQSGRRPASRGQVYSQQSTTTSTITSTSTSTSMRVGLEFRLFSYGARGPRIGSMRILVTGGSGFVGRHLLSLLRSEGHECRFTSTRETLDPLGVILRLPDERGALDILQAFQPEAVIHLAGVAFVLEAEG